MRLYKMRHLYLKTFLVAFFSAVLLFLPAMLVDKGYFLFVGDFNSQQIPFYMISHHAVRSGEFGWNWYTDLGANFIGSYTFYLLGSPFFWMTIPFPEWMVPYLMGPLLMLKFALAAVFGTLYLRRYVRRDYFALLGGLLYAFSGYSIYNIFFNHFHEAIVFFPLLLYSLDELMEKGRRGLFAFAVALNALISYFFFFGEVVFVVIYFFVRLAMGGYKWSFRRFFHIFIEAVLGFLMSMVLMLPSLLSVLQNSRVDNFASGFNLWLYGNKERISAIFASLLFPPELPSQQILLPDAGTKWTSLNAYLPLIGVSCAVTFMHAYKKHWLTRLLQILLLMALIPGLNSLFVAFNASYYARWFYMFTLMLVLASVSALDKGLQGTIHKTTWQLLTLTMVLVLILTLTPEFTAEKEFLRLGLYDSNNWIYFVVISTVSVLSLLGFTYLVQILRKKPRVFATRAVILVLIISVLYGNFFIFWGKSRSYDTHHYLISAAIEGEEKITVPDKNEVIRIDADDALINMGMFWRISCMRAFHSVVPGSIMDFYKYIGEKRDVSSKIPEEQYALRGLLSVHWYFDRIGSSTDFGDPEEEEPQTLMPGFRYYDDMAGYHVWENEYYIPMGFTYDEFLLKSQLDEIPNANKGAAMLHAVAVEDEAAERFKKTLTQVTNLRDLRFSKEAYKLDCENRRLETVSDLQRVRTGVTCRTDFLTEEFVFFSIPYDEGWSLRIDGKPEKLYRANVGFMGFFVPAGDHEIELVYETPGLKMGLMVTGGSFGCFVLYFIIASILDRAWKKKQIRRGLAGKEESLFPWEGDIPEGGMSSKESGVPRFLEGEDPC